MLPIFAISQHSKKELQKVRKTSRAIFGSLPFDNSSRPDTLFYSNKKIKAIGFYYVAKETGVSYQLGNWIEFYETGALKSEGNYQIQIYPGCCAYPCTIHNSYKTGEWRYFYENKNLKAKGKYSYTKTRINTRRKRVSVIRHKVKNNWILLAPDGKAISDKSKLILELESN